MFQESLGLICSMTGLQAVQHANTYGMVLHLMAQESKGEIPTKCMWRGVTGWEGIWQEEEGQAPICVASGAMGVAR